MSTTPNLLAQLKSTGTSVLDALRNRYTPEGPGSLTAGPGSVLDQRAVQLQNLLPQHQLLQPAQLPLAPADRIDPHAQYGDRTPEQRIDVTEMTKPLGSGLAGIRRKGSK